jgi:hypothetical protein
MAKSGPDYRYHKHFVQSSLKAVLENSSKPELFQNSQSSGRNDDCWCIAEQIDKILELTVGLMANFEYDGMHSEVCIMLSDFFYSRVEKEYRSGCIPNFIEGSLSIFKLHLYELAWLHAASDATTPRNKETRQVVEDRLFYFANYIRLNQNCMDATTDFSFKESFTKMVDDLLSSKFSIGFADCYKRLAEELMIPLAASYDEKKKSMGESRLRQQLSNLLLEIPRNENQIGQAGPWQVFRGTLKFTLLKKSVPEVKLISLSSISSLVGVPSLSGESVTLEEQLQQNEFEREVNKLMAEISREETAVISGYVHTNADMNKVLANIQRTRSCVYRSNPKEEVKLYLISAHNVSPSTKLLFKDFSELKRINCEFIWFLVSKNKGNFNKKIKPKLFTARLSYRKPSETHHKSCGKADLRENMASGQTHGQCACNTLAGTGYLRKRNPQISKKEEKVLKFGQDNKNNSAIVPI